MIRREYSSITQIQKALEYEEGKHPIDGEFNYIVSLGKHLEMHSFKRTFRELEVDKLIYEKLPKNRITIFLTQSASLPWYSMVLVSQGNVCTLFLIFSKTFIRKDSLETA